MKYRGLRDNDVNVNGQVRERGLGAQGRGHRHRHVGLDGERQARRDGDRGDAEGAEHALVGRLRQRRQLRRHGHRVQREAAARDAGRARAHGGVGGPAAAGRDGTRAAGSFCGHSVIHAFPEPHRDAPYMRVILPGNEKSRCSM